jgi:putative hemolysin
MTDFYKMDPGAWDHGTANLSLEEEAAYLRVVNAMHKNKSPVPNNDRVWAGMFRCSTRKARALVAALIDAGKLALTEDGLVNAWTVQVGERPAIPADIRKAVKERDGNVCAYCDSKDGPFHLDHIVPWSRGGQHTIENLTVACAPCNWSKGDKTLDEWRPRH